jgi:acetyltransferase-like isoleucine patch superfamily enzyme
MNALSSIIFRISGAFLRYADEAYKKTQVLALGSFGMGSTIGRNVEFVGCSSRIFVGSNVYIGDGARFVVTDETAKIIIGDNTIIQPMTYFETGRGGQIELGQSNSVNPYCVIYGHGGLVTGNFVRIASQTVIIPANHIFDNPDQPIARQGLSKRGIKIENDVWIGSGCRILDGVKIGGGSVIAAGAVVNRDVAPSSVMGGVPAKLLKMRIRHI